MSVDEEPPAPVDLLLSIGVFCAPVTTVDEGAAAV